MKTFDRHSLRLLLLLVTGCSGTVVTTVTFGSGGVSDAAGGSQASGGSLSVGGTPATSSGGAATGGLSTGSVIGVGGSTESVHSALGGAATGGAANPATGGAAATGGISNTDVSIVSTIGGTSVTGGTSSTGDGLGGSLATGGADAATGGVPGTGTATLPTGGAGTGGAATGGTSETTGGAGSGGTGTASTTTASSLLSQCTLLLHMDEASWSGTAGEVIDASGFGNNGMSVAGATTSSTAVFDKAGQFVGAGYVTITSSDSLHAMGAFTVSAWIYPTLLDGSRAPGIVSKRLEFQKQTEFAVFLWSENRLFVDVMGEEDRFSSNTQFSIGNWYHVAVVFDGSLSTEKRVSVYVNGQLDRTAPESSSVVAAYDSPVEVGNLAVGGQTFVGSIDEVAMWQRALSADEVVSIYQRTSAL